jgi:hypothetical protein
MKDIREMKYQTDRIYVFHTGLKYKADITADKISLTKDGVLTIAEGYLYDGPTGAIDTPDFMLPSLEHDALCQLVHDYKSLPLHYRRAADKLLDKRLKDEGMKWANSNVVKLTIYNFRRWYVRRAIQAYVKLRYGL